MRNLNSMKSKTVLIKVSAGWTTQRFLDEYEITQEVFDKKIKEIFPHQRGREDVLRNLMQNDKRVERAKNSLVSRKKISQQSNMADSSLEGKTSEDGIQQSDDEQSAEQIVHEDRLAFLKDCILAVDKKIAELSDEYSEAVSKKERTLLLEKKKMEVLIDTFEKRLAEKKQELERIINEISEEDAKIERIESSIADKKQKREEFEREIGELTKLQIFVYEDGNIDVEQFDGEIIYSTSNSATDAFNITPKEFQCAWEGEYNRLLDSKEIPAELDEALEDMTRKEIKQLSKVIALVNYITQTGSFYDITFECERVQGAWTLCQN